MSSQNSYIALTSKNIQQNELNLNEYITIDKSIADTFLLRSKIYKNDIVLSYTGEYRRALVMLEDNFQLGPNICRIRPLSSDNVNSFYLSVFLNSKYGQQLLDREKTLSAQPTVAMSRIRRLPIPILNSEIQQSITSKYLRAEELRKESSSKYKEAEDLLYKALMMDQFRISDNNTSVKSLKNSFEKSGRLDAEYYQTKFDNLFELLSKFKGDTLDNLVDIGKSIEPGSEAYQDKGIPFVRVQDLSKFGISETDVYLSPKDYSNVIRPKKDTILLSKDGSVGIAYKVESDSDYITSGAILHLSIKDRSILPDYLTLVLNSIVVKMQAERDAGGSIIQHWKPSEIEKVIIPILSDETQKIISDKLKQSFELRKEAKRLLDEAKQKVEQMILNYLLQIPHL